MIDLNNIPLDDKEVYKNIYHKGNTWGVFQLDSSIGIKICKDFQPSDISGIGLCISVIRPGVLRSYDSSGQSMTKVICNRKHGIEKNPLPPHESLRDILQSTYYVNVYQETTLQIVQLLAGFDGVQSDTLRRGIGKKRPELISSLEQDFIDGCKRVGLVDEKTAKDIFENIKASNRYAFNKCLSPSTILETDNNEFKTIEDINVGENIRCPNGWCKVLNKYYNGKKICIKVTMETGEEIICTSDHKFLCDDGYIRPLYQLTSNKYFIVCNNNIGFSKIKEVKYIGEIDTMDIEVDSPNHIFYGNQIATSNSHAISYAIISYQTAYLKHYYPLHFYKACLISSLSQQKPHEEVKNLVLDGRTNGVTFAIPDLRHKQLDGYIRNDTLYFGISNIKQIGKSAQTALLDIIKETELETGKPLDDFLWTDFLFLISDKVNSQAIESLIYCGALDFMKIPRSQMFFEYEKYQMLTKGEKKWVVEKQKMYPFSTLYDALLAVSPKKKLGGGCHTDKKTEFVLGLAQTIDKPSLKIKDSPKFIAMMEEKYLGISITCSKSDGSFESDIANYTCADINSGQGSINISFVGEIARYKEYQTKNGDSAGRFMCFIDIFDKTASLSESALIFPNLWEDVRDNFDEKASYFFIGKRGKKNSIIIENLQKIK